MENSSRKRLNDILHHLAEIDYVHPEDIPNIDLYMDQVLTFLAQELGTVREVNEDKAITKTMINNYTKNQLMPPPEKKKYSRDHMLNLIFIYYFKNFLGLKDIKSILDPINEKYYGDNEGLDFFDIYCDMVGFERKITKEITKDIIKKYNMSREAFTDQDEESKDVLQDFTFICLLSFDVFVKKMMIEQYISKRREDEGKEEKQDNQDNNEKPKEK